MRQFTIEPPYYLYKGESKEYPWPCKPLPNRMIELIEDDILVENTNFKTPDGNNTFDMITGIYKAGIHIPKEDLILVTDKSQNMIMD